MKKREEEGSDAELSEEEEEEEEEGEEAAESQEEERKPKGPGPLLKGFYYGPGREFWLSMVSDSGMRCIWGEGGGGGGGQSIHC